MNVKLSQEGHWSYFLFVRRYLYSNCLRKKYATEVTQSGWNNLPFFAVMTTIGHALLLLATISVVFSIPDGYNCAWQRDQCTRGRIMLAQCNCDCGLLNNMLCCDRSILDDYYFPVWHGTAPLCGASCIGDCKSTDPAYCWWQSKCGNGSRCMTGSKYLCGTRRRRWWWPFLDKAVSSLLQRY